jgi:glycosyltransferase involved in cell wall biosynthesis
MKVSIIVPAYNSEKYIRQCLDSIEKQTHKDLDVIVVDNESTDGTVAIIDEYCAKNGWRSASAPNLYKYSWHEPTRLAMSMINEDSEWFTIVATDDYLESGYIKSCVKIVNAMEKFGLQVEAFQSPFMGFGGKQGVQLHQYGCTVDSYFGELKKKCVVNTPTVFWRSDLIGRGMMESHPEKFGGADDYWMYLNQASKGLLIYPYPNWIGYNYRWNEDQATWGMHKDYKGVEKTIQEEFNEKS